MNKDNTQTTLDFFIFDPNIHGHYVEDFLHKASLAHKHEVRSKEWFHWKFFENPYGDSILACAATKTEIVGCVAYGKQNFIINGETHKGVLSFETFVDPSYQGQGLFTKLLQFAEEEARRQQIKIMLNFPNSQSLRGFLKKDWHQLDISAYYFRPRLRLNFLLNFIKIKTPFVSLETNLSEIKDQLPESFEYKIKASHEALITLEYLKYRFFDFSNGNYKVYNENNNFAIGRVGMRGGLKELQILLINLSYVNSREFSKVIKGLVKSTAVDLVSYPTSLNSSLVPILKKKWFIKVPNKTNVCYKILDDNLDLDMEKLELSAINFHTY